MDKLNLLNGYYGYSNFGDDLFVEVFKKHLANQGISKVVFSHEKSAGFSGKLDQIFNTLKANTITLGGGSILGVSGYSSIRNAEIYLKDIIKFKYSAVGVGLYDHKNIPIKMIKKMDFLAVRSVRDFDLLKKHYPNVFYGSDLAYAYSSLFDYNKNNKNNKNNIGLILTDIGYYANKLIIESNVKKFIDFIKINFSNDYLINIYNLQPARYQDQEIISKVIYYFKKYKVNYSYFNHINVHETISNISVNKFVFTDRLHGGIISHVLGIPFSLSLHHNKCYDFLHDVGYLNTLFNFEKSYSNDFILDPKLSLKEIVFHESLALSSLNLWYSKIFA